MVRRRSFHPCKEGEGNWETFVLIACNLCFVSVLRVMCYSDGRLRVANGRLSLLEPQLALVAFPPLAPHLGARLLQSARSFAPSRSLNTYTPLPPLPSPFHLSSTTLATSSLSSKQHNSFAGRTTRNAFPGRNSYSFHYRFDHHPAVSPQELVFGGKGRLAHLSPRRLSSSPPLRPLARPT